MTPLAVFAGKVAFALASTAACFGWRGRWRWRWPAELPDPLFHQRMWVLCGLGGVELLAWGIFFSLLLKRPLLAAILAGTACRSLRGSFAASRTRTWICIVDLVRRSVPARLMILALVTMVDIGLAARWFRERWFHAPARPQSSTSTHASARSRSRLSSIGSCHAGCGRAREATGEAFDPAPLALTMLGRLVWQELRQSAAMTAALIAWLLPAVFIPLGGVDCWDQSGVCRRAMVRPHSCAVPVFAAVFSAPLLGSVVFLADQTGCRFRFLAEHGIPPRLVWLSRQIRGLLIMLLGLLLVLPPTIGLIVTRQLGRYDDGNRSVCWDSWSWPTPAGSFARWSSAAGSLPWPLARS